MFRGTQSSKPMAEEDKNTPPKPRSWTRELLDFALIVLLVVLPIRYFVAEPYIVTGVSMADTYATGHYLIINKFEYKLGSIDRGDVLVFRSPVEEDKFYIKRVIGLPGETISIHDGHVYAQSEDHEEILLEEPYASSRTLGTTLMELDDDEYFMMGDNRIDSFDSRSWGPLNIDNIRGEPVLRLFPLNKIDLMPGRYRQGDAVPDQSNT
ncbi:MAG: signal peptidase I [Patescibacteria group bacterium]